MLRLENENVYRGKGPVDLLIGVDHARMHTGETRQAGHLEARHSPLGWVIFGATPGDARETKRILCVKYTMPEDRSDFRKTEAMGVAGTPSLCAADKLSQIEKEAKITEVTSNRETRSN